MTIWKDDEDEYRLAKEPNQKKPKQRRLERPEPEAQAVEAEAQARAAPEPSGDNVFSFPGNKRYLDLTVDLATLPIPLVRFAGLKQTIPEREWICIGLPELAAEIAPTPTPMIWYKHNVPYYIAGTLKAAEFVGQTRERALREGRPTFGKQRSNSHTASLGPAVFFDDDRDVFARIQRLKALGVAAIVYSSHSYGFEKDGATEPSKSGRVVVFLNRAVTPDELGAIWDAIDHLLGGGFDENASSISHCYGRHVRRSVNAPYKREIIDGAALNADALIELGRELRPPRAPGAGTRGEPAPADVLTEETERVQLMGRVRPPDEYLEWMSGAGAFKRHFPDKEENAFQCFDIWSSCSGKYAGNDATRKKFDEVPAEYDGDKTPVTLGMLHARAKRRATEMIRSLYLPRFEPAGRFAHLDPDKDYLGEGIDDDGTYPKGGEPIPPGTLKPEDGLTALEYILFCWSNKALEGLHVPQRELEEARRRTEARHEQIDLDGRVLHVWRGSHLSQDTNALADAIIASGLEYYRYDKVLVRLSAPISDPATAARVRKLHKYQGPPGDRDDPAQSARMGLVPILPSDTEALRAGIAARIATKIPVNRGTRSKPNWQYEIGSFGFHGKNIRQEPDNEVLKDLAKRALPDRAPEIIGVITAPVMPNLPTSTKPEDLLRADADYIITKPGFDPATGLYLAPVGIIVEVPAEPSQEQVKVATDLLRKPWRQFPFESPGENLPPQVSRAVVIYGSMIAANRRVLKLAPGIAMDSPGEGFSSGKTLSEKIIGCISSGEIPRPVSLSPDFNEQRKEIITYLVEGTGVLFLDNTPIGTRFDAAPLASAMTSEEFEGRLLGYTKSIKASTRTMVLANGCSLNMAGDIASRFLRGRLDTGLERPEDRSVDEYEISDLCGWTVEHYQQIVAAVHTVVRAYLQECRRRDGTPPEVAKRRSRGTRFEGPCEVLRDAFLWGFPDLSDPFLGFVASTLASSTRLEKAELLHVLERVMKKRDWEKTEFTAKELILMLTDAGDLDIVEAAMHTKGGNNSTINSVRFGLWLKNQMADAHINGLVLRAAKNRDDINVFWIEQSEKR